MIVYTVRDLAAIESIKRLKALYFYYLDHKDWEGWRSHVFVPEVIVTVPNSWDEPLVGLDLFIERVSRNTLGATTIHHGHMPSIEILSADTAAGIWAMEDVIHFSPENPMLGKYIHMHGYGHYHETYLRTGQGWRIASMELRRLHLERR